VEAQGTRRSLVAKVRAVAVEAAPSTATPANQNSAVPPRSQSYHRPAATRLYNQHRNIFPVSLFPTIALLFPPPRAATRYRFRIHRMTPARPYPVMGTHSFIRYIVTVTVTSLVTTVTNEHLQ
jgi:hypothetical protein